jgi:hypothetical protein
MDYRFRPVSRNCAGTGKPLVPGSTCYSVLIERNGQQERFDYSEEGWKGLPADAVGSWRCIVPGLEQKPSVFSNVIALWQLFEQIVEDPNPAQARLVYVLALSLLQKRKLKLDGTQMLDGEEFLELSGSGGEGPYLVRNQELTETEIASYRQAIEQMANSGLEAA